MYGPEPALGEPLHQDTIRHHVDWTRAQHKSYWAKRPGHSHSKACIDKACMKKNADLLLLGRTQSRIVTGFLTGHANVKEHLWKIFTFWYIFVLNSFDVQSFTNRLQQQHTNKTKMPAQETFANELDRHTADVTTMVFQHGILYTGGEDGLIKAWEPTLKRLCEVKAHTSIVTCLTASNDILYSCSDDGTIKAWRLNDLAAKGTIFKEEVELLKIFFSSGMLFSSDNAAVVRVHVGKDVRLVYNIAETVKDLVVMDNVMYAVRDMDLIITRLLGDQYAIRKSLPGRAPICIAGDKLCFPSRGGKDIVIHENSQDLEYKELTKVKNAHELYIKALIGTQRGGDTFLFSAGWDKILKQWKIGKDSAKLVNTCNTNIVVNTLAHGNKGEIFAGGSDGQVVRIQI